MADPNNIKADEAYRTAVAERGKFFPVDTDYLTSIGYPTSGEGKYAILTYPVTQPSFTLSGDIVLGAMELKDQDTDDRVNIIPLTNSNAMATMIVDESGNQISSFGASTSDQSPSGVVANTTIVQGGGIAEITIPSPVSDGDAVATWFDEYGRQVIFGANMSLNAIDVNNVNDPILSRLGPITNLNAVTATGAGALVDVSNYHNFTIQYISSSTTPTSGAILDIQHSLDGTNWSTIYSDTVTADETNEIVISNTAYRYLRTNIPTYYDGTYTTYIYAGN